MKLKKKKVNDQKKDLSKKKEPEIMSIDFKEFGSRCQLRVDSSQ
jgi:hypothetical protein